MASDLRSAPFSEEAEKAVLGAMLIDTKAIGTAVISLSEASFYIDKHGFIYKALVQIYDSNNTADFVSIISQLEKNDHIDQVSRDYIIELGNFVPSSANIDYYIRIVKEKEQYRSLINVCNELIQKAYSQEDDVTELLDRAESEVFRLAESGETKGYEHVKSAINRVMENLEKLHSKKTELTGIDTGYKELNVKTAGWQNSDLIILAGRPSMGKTAFVLNLAQNAAISFNKSFQSETKEFDKHKLEAEQKGESLTLAKPHQQSVAIFSLEMGMDQLVQRLITTTAMIDGTKIRTGGLQEQDWIKLSNSIGQLYELPIFIDDDAGLSLMELRAKCRRLKVEKNAGLIIIDYLQLMEVSGAESRQQEISKISRSLKILAKELNVPIIALSQLSRALEQRNDKRPMLSDLRESGSIEQDADVVMFIHRPEYYKIESFDDDTPTENMAEVIIGKQRNGPIGDVRLTFLKQFGKFADPDTIHVEASTNGFASSDPGF
ncbi:MAG: replicative DNA helicase [Calditrichaeota bacterium]|nr:replicative DNA helicase [Calditrichota bacterium]